MGSPRCQWVRDRLPLLAGGDLHGPDRRWVERHLIGCVPCREHQAALGQALDVLRMAATTATASGSSLPQAPSLWPALAQQIRESRRPVSTSPFTWPAPVSAALAWLRLNSRPALGFGLGFGLLATTILGLGIRHQLTGPEMRIAANGPSINTSRTLPLLVQTPPSSSPLKSKNSTKPKLKVPREVPLPVVIPIVEGSSPPPRIDYDLEDGRPMPETREIRDTKATY
jgi:hypothetical protein